VHNTVRKNTGLLLILSHNTEPGHVLPEDPTEVISVWTFLKENYICPYKEF